MFLALVLQEEEVLRTFQGLSRCRCSFPGWLRGSAMHGVAGFSAEAIAAGAFLTAVQNFDA